MIEPLHAILLGVVEGLTEFLPISSTGHLILASRALNLYGPGVNSFGIVIQLGAILAVVGLYRERLFVIWRGLLGKDPSGQKLLVNFIISFIPAAIAGLLLHRIIKAKLFQTWPVVLALVVGGILMIAVDRAIRRRGLESGTDVWSLSNRQALLIGCAQCFALWPGTSRSMVVIVAGLLVGLSASAAAEYSFLLAIPTLGAATVFDAIASWQILAQEAGMLSMLLGLVTAAVVAALAIKGFIHFLTRQGLALFGWYRLALASLVWGLAR